MIIEGTWYIIGTGINFDDDEIEILPYLKLKKVNKLTVLGLANLGTKGFYEWSLIQPFCYTQNIFEIISCENEKSYGYDILNRAWLLNTLIALKKYTRINIIALSDVSWSEIENLKKEDKVRANLCDYHVKMINFNSINRFNLSSDDIIWFNKNFEVANDLAFNSDKFRYCIEIINSCRYNVEPKSAIAILWSAIESIVDASQEISFKLSLSISSLLYERGEKRLKKFEDIKKLYNLRSKIVHGSNIKTDEINRALEESFDLLSELIIYMIENKKVITQLDFTNSIFK